MVTAADSGSIYEPYPALTYEWDPDRGTPTTFASLGTARSSSNHGANGTSPTSSPGGGGIPDETWNKMATVNNFDLGPHPADPHSTVLPVSPSGTTFPIQPSASSSTTHSGFASFPFGGANGYGIVNGTGLGPNACQELVPGQEIYVYGGAGGTFTFWRFLIRVPLAEKEMAVTYSVNGGQKMAFYVPGRYDNMRMALHSVSRSFVSHSQDGLSSTSNILLKCNGFSAGVNPDDFRGPGFKTGYDPVWMDLLAKHTDKPFHALVGGGDQIYCDGYGFLSSTSECSGVLNMILRRGLACCVSLKCRTGYRR